MLKCQLFQAKNSKKCFCDGVWLVEDICLNKIQWKENRYLHLKIFAHTCTHVHMLKHTNTHLYVHTHVHTPYMCTLT
jgi:hypothetical protein